MGIYFYNINHIGDYEIKFTMDGLSTNWTIERSHNNGVTWNDYSGIGYLDFVSTNNDTVPNTIAFVSNVASGGSVDLEAGISKMQLTDESEIFQGGSASSWSFD